MTALDEQELFASGPHVVEVQPARREMLSRRVAGLDGELLIDMGRRGRRIGQSGRLSGETAAGVQGQVDAIAACADGQAHSLTDDLGRTFAVMVESFELSSPIQLGRGWWCEYRINYLELT